jgi:hypothetical protein
MMLAGAMLIAGNNSRHASYGHNGIDVTFVRALVTVVARKVANSAL